MRECGFDDFTGSVSVSVFVGFRLDWTEMVARVMYSLSSIGIGSPGLRGLAPATTINSGCDLLLTSQLWQMALSFVFSPSMAYVLGDGLEGW